MDAGGSCCLYASRNATLSVTDDGVQGVHSTVSAWFGFKDEFHALYIKQP